MTKSLQRRTLENTRDALGRMEALVKDLTYLADTTVPNKEALLEGLTELRGRIAFRRKLLIEALLTAQISKVHKTLSKQKAKSFDFSGKVKEEGSPNVA